MMGAGTGSSDIYICITIIPSTSSIAVLLCLQVLRIVTLGSNNGKGGFFPKGVNGRINTPAGYTNAANAKGGYPGNQVG